MTFFPLRGLGARLDNDVASTAVKNFNVYPSIINSRIQNDKYYFTFNNMCSSGIISRGIVKVDQKILEKKLNEWVRLADRKYMKLESFDSNKSVFIFDIEEWINDSMKKCVPYNNYANFSRSYKMGINLPYIVSVYGLEMMYRDYIVKKFKDYLKKNSKLRKDLFSIVENVTNKTLGISSLSIFEYRYDKISNSIIASVNPIYVGGIVATATMLAKDDNWKKKIDFDKTVGMFLKFKK